MHGKSENADDYQRSARPVVAMAKNFARGYRIAPHSHRRSQLIFAESGVMTVFNASARWVVPPTRAIWIPAGIVHGVRANSQLFMRTVYVETSTRRSLPSECAVVSVQPLLRELLLEAVKIPNNYEIGGREERIMKLIVDEIRTIDVLPLHLPMPGNPKALIVAQGIIAEPGKTFALEDWARVTGISGRTLARIFRSELGTTFGQWRQQARLQASLDLLASRTGILDVAMAVGYESPSAFAFAFRKCFGVAPTEYFKF